MNSASQSLSPTFIEKLGEHLATLYPHEQAEPALDRLLRLLGAFAEAHPELRAVPEGSRVVVEKPFCSDLESARRLNRLLHDTFPEESVFRVDHFRSGDYLKLRLRGITSAASFSGLVFDDVLRTSTDQRAPAQCGRSAALS